MFWRVLAIAVALTLSLGILPGLVSTHRAAAQDDASISQNDWEDLVDEATTDDPAYGPEEGDLEIDPEKVTFSQSDIEDADFYAEATFQNPYDGNDDQFDYGIQFRSSEDAFLRLIIVSDGTWAITDSTEDDPLIVDTYEDLDSTSTGENKVAVYVEGETIHVAINDDYVGSATTQVTQEGSISVGTSFLPESVVEGESTGYTDFSIWTLSDSNLGPDDEETPQNDEETPDTDTDVDKADGESYESPTFGYVVLYDPDVWEVTQDESEDNVDDFRLSNGASTVQFLGLESDQTPDECIQDTIDSLTEDADLEDVEIATDADDEDLQGTLDDGSAYVVVNLTFEDTPLTAFYQCTTIEEGESIVKINQIVDAEAYNDEIEARISLLEGFSVDGKFDNGDDGDSNSDDQNTDDGDTQDEEETPQADETATDDLPEGSVVVYLEASTEDGPVVLASLIPDNDETEVQLFVLAGEPGLTYDAAFADGTCKNPGDTTIDIGTTDETGLLDENVEETVENLSSGDFIMVLLDEGGDVVACGDPSEFVE